MEYFCAKCGRILEESSIDAMRCIPDPSFKHILGELKSSLVVKVCIPCFEDYAEHTTGDLESVCQWWNK